MTKKKNEDFDDVMNFDEANTNKKEKLYVASENFEDSQKGNDFTSEQDGDTVIPKKKRTAKKKSNESTFEMEKEDSILTIDVDGYVQSEEELAEIAWHEIHNAYRTRKILTGMLGGLEVLDGGNTVAVVEYKGYRVIIPIKEMAVLKYNKMSPEVHKDFVLRQQKLISSMLGAEIDFIIKGIDSKTRSAVASRKEAMIKKRQTFYMETDANGAYKIYDGRIVQARVIAVAEKGIRIEAFGVECSIILRNLSWNWIGDARDHYSTGDEILVRILSVNRTDVDNIYIQADVKSVEQNNKRSNLNLCRVQGKYAGKVIDVHKGVVYLRLTNGINAIAHSCLDRRMPAKKDEVSFAVTAIEEERGVAIGIITRIIKQNL